jgi:hypothetical protein
MELEVTPKIKIVYLVIEKIEDSHLGNFEENRYYWTKQVCFVWDS